MVFSYGVMYTVQISKGFIKVQESLKRVKINPKMYFNNPQKLSHPLQFVFGLYFNFAIVFVFVLYF